MITRIRGGRIRFLVRLVFFSLGLWLIGLVGQFEIMAAEGDELEDLLEQVTQQYAEGYLKPLITALGVNQMSGLFTTAAIPTLRPAFNVGLKVNASRIAEEDQTFQKVARVKLDESFGLEPDDFGYGMTGTVIMRGPTVFGNDQVKGAIEIPLTGQTFSTIEGLVDTRWAPLVVPEGTVSIAGVRGTLRWFPSIDVGDLGKLKFFGYGLAVSANQFLQALPIDVMGGFFRQDLDLGGILETNASSYFLAASKTFTLLTVYAGAAKESSDVKVTYTFRDPTGNESVVKFEQDGVQKDRLTLGATLNMGMKINAEVSKGKLANYTAGVLFGF